MKKLFFGFCFAAMAAFAYEFEDVPVTIHWGIRPYLNNESSKPLGPKGTYLSILDAAESQLSVSAFNERFRLSLVYTGDGTFDETTGWARIRRMATQEAVENQGLQPTGNLVLETVSSFPADYFGFDEETYDVEEFWLTSTAAIVVEDLSNGAVYRLSSTENGLDRVAETDFQGQCTFTTEPQTGGLYGETAKDNDFFFWVETPARVVYLGAPLPASCAWRLQAGFETEADVAAWRVANGVSASALDAAIALGMTDTNAIPTFAASFAGFGVSVASWSPKTGLAELAVVRKQTAGPDVPLTSLAYGASLKALFGPTPVGPWTQTNSLALPASEVSLSVQDTDAGYYSVRLDVPHPFAD